MVRRALAVMVGLALSSAAMADVVMLAADAGKEGHRVKIGDKTQRSLAKADAGRAPDATGSIALTDASGMEYFINTDITFTTSSSASGAASEASYTQAVNATTLNGGLVSTTLNDAFDGYNSLCVSFDGGTGPCASGGGGKNLGFAYTMYNQNGPATLDTACASRQVILPTETIGALSVQRKVFVPDNDAFARWLNVFTNTSGSSVSFNMIASNNLGSDSNTTIVSSSSGDAAATTADLWVTTFQNFSGTTSSDPRLGHVLAGPGAPTPVSGINFANGDDNPFWSYSMTLAPGETRIIANFVAVQASRADANAKAAELTAFTGNQTACMTSTELGQVANFVAGTQAPDVPVPATDRRILAALAALTAALGVLALRARRA